MAKLFNETSPASMCKELGDRRTCLRLLGIWMKMIDYYEEVLKKDISLSVDHFLNISKLAYEKDPRETAELMYFILYIAYEKFPKSRSLLKIPAQFKLTIDEAIIKISNIPLSTPSSNDLNESVSRDMAGMVELEMINMKLNKQVKTCQRHLIRLYKDNLDIKNKLIASEDVYKSKVFDAQLVHDLSSQLDHEKNKFDQFKKNIERDMAVEIDSRDNKIAVQATELTKLKTILESKKKKIEQLEEENVNLKFEVTEYKRHYKAQDESYKDGAVNSSNLGTHSVSNRNGLDNLELNGIGEILASKENQQPSSMLNLSTSRNQQLAIHTLDQFKKSQEEIEKELAEAKLYIGDRANYISILEKSVKEKVKKIRDVQKNSDENEKSLDALYREKDLLLCQNKNLISCKEENEIEIKNLFKELERRKELLDFFDATYENLNSTIANIQSTQREQDLETPATVKQNNILLKLFIILFFIIVISFFVATCWLKELFPLSLDSLKCVFISSQNRNQIGI
uniref:HOOK_N domain-containing protein n=1 Tax=Rhabditophanes sp. KR3021 TaxID=114890 RepID=A0AC35TTW1_9BILA